MSKKLDNDVINLVLSLSTDQARNEYHKVAKAQREYNKELEEYREQRRKVDTSTSEGIKKLDDLNKKIQETEEKIKINETKMSNLRMIFDKSSMTVRELRQFLKQLNKEFENTSKKTHPEEYKRLQHQIEETKQALYRATGQTEKLKNSFIALNKTKQVLTGFFFGIGDAILNHVVGAFKNVFNLIVDFERANSRLASILGVSKAEIKNMEAAARQLGGSTAYSAAEVTNLQVELAKLGFNKQQILDMEGAVLKFATAVDTDLARASAFAGAALNIFGKDHLASLVAPADPD